MVNLQAGKTQWVDVLLQYFNPAQFYPGEKGCYELVYWLSLTDKSIRGGKQKGILAEAGARH